MDDEFISTVLLDATYIIVGYALRWWLYGWGFVEDE